MPEELKEVYAHLPEKVDYNIHIKPILSDRCFKCHGPDANQRKADYRIDDSDHAFSAPNSDMSLASFNLKAGSLSKSEVFNRIIAKDPEYQMPPPDSNLKLSNREKALIAKWIEDGAEYKAHWAFEAPEKPNIPKIENSDWAANNIDHFILYKMGEADLKPNDIAEKEVLLRRITLDITGLIPSPEEIDNFLDDDSEDAYEKVIDALLQKQEYGEKMAVGWLDVARYADTHGYQDDGLRNVWPWREWVINSFNANMSYDQFITEQLAGDLLPNATKDQILATCFNRNHPQTQEGGVVEEEYRVEYVADRTNTIGKGILGLTMECARCHDHKYDPISQKDYYSLSAFFNNNDDSGIVPYNGEAAPTILLPTASEEMKLDSLANLMKPYAEALVSEKYVNDLEVWLHNKEIDLSLTQGLVASFAFEEEVQADKSKMNLDGKKSAGWGGVGKKGRVLGYVNKAKGIPDAAIFGDKDNQPLLEEGKEGKGLLFRGDCGIRFNRDMDFDRYQSFSAGIWFKVLNEGEKGPIFNNTNGDFEGYRGWICKLNEDGTLSFQLNHVWPDNAIDYQTVEPVQINEWNHVVMTYDGSSKANGFRIYLNGKQPELVLHKDNLRKSLQHGVKGSNWSSFPLLLGKEKERSIQNVVMDEFSVYDRELSEIEAIKLYSGKNPDAPNQEQILEYYLLSGKNELYNSYLDSLTSLRKIQNTIATDVLEVMVMGEKKITRPTYILDRGMYDARRETVEPYIPETFGVMSDQLPKNRLGLAQWVVNEKNPLTARVQVNRIWNMLFGKGLVATQEDFGNQGNLPSHPKLLDWLAIDFMENGWDNKRLIKQIMMSSTYRQSSIASNIAREKDPVNTYYSHYPAHRLSAEVIRGNALASSGLLVQKIGGPSVYPYQPDGIWKALATRNATVYNQGEGEDLYRRSIYTIWKRSAPPPAMMNFDTPDRYSCVVSRQKTATPLQSLVLMNDPQYVEASRKLAEKAMLLDSNSRTDEIVFMFKSLISKRPNDEQLTLLEEMYEEEYEMFSENESKVEGILKVGEYQHVQEMDYAALAANTMIASTIMNFDEFVMKR